MGAQISKTAGKEDVAVEKPPVEAVTIVTKKDIGRQIAPGTGAPAEYKSS